MEPAKFGLLLLLEGLLTLSVVRAGFPEDCGQRKHKITQLIVNGTQAKIVNWPWHTAIFHREGTTFSYKCGGTILDKSTILTAAHCIRTESGIITSDRLSVQVGRNRLNVADDRAQEHQAERILIHKDFRTDSVDHDIALIKLATDIKFTPFVQPICVWNRGDDRLVLRNLPGTIVGFGATTNADYSEVLNEAELPVVDNQVCIDSNREVFGQALTGNMYCAGRRDGTNACNGDSGGGMFFLVGDRWYVRGIVSFSPRIESTGRCDPLHYVVFTDVARYVQWIAQQLNATFVEPIVTHPKLHLLNQDICGANPYMFSREADKPILLTYPWIGLIEYTQEGVRERKLRCHALLISERYLVTAAHCVYNTKGYRAVAIRLGDYDTASAQDCDQLSGQRTCSPPIQTLQIETITIHQQYNKPAFANDIALIRLRQPADIDQENVKPICLPLTRTLRSYKPTQYIRTGWKSGEIYTRMQRSEVNVVESVECQKTYAEARIALQKTFQQICVERDPKGSDGKCILDRSATPLQAVQTIDGSPRYVLHGLLSFGEVKCQRMIPDVYTNIGTYLDWILDKLQE